MRVPASAPVDPFSPTRVEPLTGPSVAPVVVPPGFLFGGRYRAASFLGAGGMGTVYAGVDLRTGREVAIKILNQGADVTAERRFLREAELAFSVKHEHLCEVLEAGFEAGLRFIVMERLHGETLHARLKRSGTLSVADSVTIAVQLLQALGAAHATHVIHRDVKPGNVFLLSPSGAPPRSKLIDFGLAKPLPNAGRDGDSAGPITSLDAVPGTPSFLTPEQLRPDLEIDARVDVWAVGVTLFEMLTLRRPFEGRSCVELARRILQDPPARVSWFRPDAPPELEVVILRSLAKDRDVRFATAREMEAALLEVPLSASRRSGFVAVAPNVGSDDEAVTRSIPRHQP